MGVKKGPKSEILEGYFFWGYPILDPNLWDGTPRIVGYPPPPSFWTPFLDTLGVPPGDPENTPHPLIFTPQKHPFFTTVIYGVP